MSRWSSQRTGPVCRCKGRIVADVKTVRLGVDFGTSNTVAVLDCRTASRARCCSTARRCFRAPSPPTPAAASWSAATRCTRRPSIRARSSRTRSAASTTSRCCSATAPFAVVDLIAAVLQRVVGEAERAAGGPPAEIVLTCPAGWATGRRDILRQALPGAQLLEEPVAAANHLGGDLPVGHTAVVYDFGAGTFDASVIRRTAPVRRARHRGPHRLRRPGHRRGDRREPRRGAARQAGWSRLLEPESTAERRASRQLWDNVRQAKEMLSRSTSTLVHVPLVDVEVPLGREQLDEAAARSSTAPSAP